MLHAFFVVTDEDENTGFAVVSNDVEEAVKMTKEYVFVADDEPLETREIEADIEGLPLGIIEGIEGLRRSCYSWIFDACPLCHRDEILTVSEEDGLEGLICCSECLDTRIDQLSAKESA